MHAGAESRVAGDASGLFEERTTHDGALHPHATLSTPRIKGLSPDASANVQGQRDMDLIAAQVKVKFDPYLLELCM